MVDLDLHIKTLQDKLQLLLKHHQTLLRENQRLEKELEKGRQLIEARFAAGLTASDKPYGFWYDWLFARVLLREAEGMIGSAAASAKSAEEPQN